METINASIVSEIKKIVEDNRVQVIEIGERKFSTKQLTEIKPKKDTASGIRFSDLFSIVEIVKREKEKFVRPLYVNIETERSVSVITSLDLDKEREEPYSAVAEGSKFNFGCSYDYEKFVIAIRSLFVQTEDTTGLLELLKKVSNVDSVEMEDDGVTQKVVAQQGAMLATNLKVAPIRKLAPFRTFMEVEQPESEFLFRLDKNNCFSLYEADGGAWKIKAKKNIRLFFEQALNEEIAAGDVVILG
jgi:hypothetical protein